MSYLDKRKTKTGEEFGPARGRLAGSFPPLRSPRG